MPCKCKNEDGTLSDQCLGTCKVDEITEQEKQQHRDPLNGFAEMILAQVEKRIDLRVAYLRIEMNEQTMALWKEAFIEGLREGMNIREDY